MVLLEYLIYILLFLFPLGEIARFTIVNSVFLRVQDILVGIIFVVFTLRIRFFCSHTITKPIIVFFSLGVLSLIINSGNLEIGQIIISLLYGFRWIGYAAIFLTTSFFDKKIKEKIVWILLIVGTIFDVIGIAQYFLYQNLRNLFYLGWDDHLYRLFSSFLDPNYAGSFYVLFFLLLLGLLYKGIKERKKNNALIFFLLFLTLASLFLTYSRSALLMFLTGTGTFFFLIGKKRLTVIPFLLVFMFMLVVSPFFYLENVNIFRIASSKARLESFINAVAIIRDHPLIGVGFNAYRYAQIDYGFRKGEAALISHADAGTDNSFLFVLATTGVIGFLSYVYLWFSILRSAFFLHNRNKIFATVAISSIGGIFIDSLFVNTLFFPSIMLWMWIILGIMDYK